MNAALLLAIHAAATWFMVGMIWVIQVVHYPLFAFVGVSDFSSYERHHMSRMGKLLVIPASVEVVSAGLLVWIRPDSVALVVVLLAGVVLAALWVGTALVQAPLHAGLARTHDRPSIDKLVAGNWWRTAGWSLRGALALLMLL